MDLSAHGRRSSVSLGDTAYGPVTLPFVEEGRYSIKEELGRGGLGRVLRAHDDRLRRPVAIKELIEPNKENAVRFAREALVIARLQHPAIVPIHDAGRWPSGELFYVMKLISDRSFDKVIAQTSHLDERLALLPHVIAVTDAMAYAHSENIIHRDLKPNNILIGSFGETMVIDWGLAKDLSNPDEEEREAGAWEDGVEINSRSDLTVAGVVLGTPGYMPPEQAEAAPVDKRADVYALGAILYHLLTGIPPYDGNHSGEILAQVRQGPPPPLSERVPEIPQDLSTIVAKAMSRNPEDRYPSARELAEDLRRFQTGQLVSAREYSSLALIERWFRRHRGLVSLTILFLAILLGGAVASVRRVVRERNAAKAISNELRLVQARTALDRDPTATLSWLKTYPVDADDWKQVRELAIDGLSRGVARHVFRRDDSRGAEGAFSPDGRLFVCAVSGRKLRVWDVVHNKTVFSFNYSGELFNVGFSPDSKTVVFVDQEHKGLTLGDVGSGRTRTLARMQARIVTTVFSPDGRFLLTSSDDHILRLWPLAGGEPQTLSGSAGIEDTVGFSPDGRKIAFAGQDKAVHLWEVDTRQDRILAEHAGHIRHLLITPDGKFIVSDVAAKRVQLWDAENGRPRILGNTESEITALAISPDSRRVAVGGQDGTVRWWSLDSDKEELFNAHKDRVDHLAFSPDGRLLASGSEDATVRLWEPDTGDSLAWLGHASKVFTLGFSPDGRVLFSSSDDETVRLWDVPPNRGQQLRGHEDGVYRVAFSPAGRHLATGGRDHTLRVWDIETGAVRVLPGHATTLRSLKFSPDGTLLASLGNDGALLLHEAATGQRRSLRDDPGRNWGMDFSHDGRLLGLGNLNGMVHLCEVSSGACRSLAGHTGEISALVFSPDDRQMVTGSNDRLLRLWDVAAGTSRTLRGHQDNVSLAAFSPDGRFIISGGSDGHLWRWNAATGEGQALGSYPKGVKALRLSPDGRMMAVGGDEGIIQLWDLTAGTYHQLLGHRHSIRELNFSPEGTLLASGSWDATVRLWDVQARLCRTILRQGSYVMDVAFSPSGRILASPGLDKIVRLWRIQPTPTPPDDPSALLKWLSTITTATIEHSGQPATP
jgi:WD40 repeat protein